MPTDSSFSEESGRVVLAVTILVGAWHSFIDGTVVNVALPVLHAPLADVQRVVELIPVSWWPMI